MVEPYLAVITPIGGAHPSHPIAPGGGPVDPGYGVPTTPGVWPSPGQPGQLPMPGGRPPGFWGGSGVPAPTPPIYHPGHPDHGLPSQPEQPTHPIAPGGPGVGGGPIIPPPPAIEADMLILVWVRGHGFHWIAVDKDLVPEHPIELPPPAPTHPIAPGGAPPGATHPIEPTPPPTAAPKK